MPLILKHSLHLQQSKLSIYLSIYLSASSASTGGKSLKTLCCSFLLGLFLVSSAFSAPSVPLFPDGFAFERGPSYESAREQMDLYYYDESGNRRTFSLSGETWEFTIHCEQNSPVKASLLEKLKAKNPKILGEQEKLDTFEFAVGENQKIYYEIKTEWSSLSVKVLKQHIIGSGQSLSIEFTKEIKRRIFYTQMKSQQFYCLTADIGNLDRIRVFSRRRFKEPEYSSAMVFDHTFSKNHGHLHKCYSIPQIPGLTPYTFENTSPATGTVKVTLESLVPTGPYPAGIDTGAIVVKGVSWGRVEVENEYLESIYTPSFSMASKIGDATPQGDALLWLPAGLWNVSAVPYLGGIVSSSCRLVPVSGGQVTTVSFPPSLTRALAPQTDGRLEVLAVSGNENSGTMEVGFVDSSVSGNSLLTTSNTSLWEDGAPCTITSVSPIEAPVDIVLLLDSSGSMKGSMRKAVDSVKSFIKKLPDNYNVQVVDFDTTPKPIAADSRESLLQNLDSVRARGATCLFDSIILGLRRLGDSKRGALLVFTDGVDANWNDTKPGSKATKGEVLTAAKKSSVPLYTIGFGKNPDVDTLTRIAAIGHGAYYNAISKDALDAVFSQIRTNLASQYAIAFQRPEKAGLSNKPVVCLTVDNSGSMDENPETKGCDYRIERVRQILKSFVEDMPSDLSSQVITFNDRVKIAQVLTSDKDRLLRALSQMNGDYGTNILESVRASYASLASVPSSRRYLVYITDAALKVAPDVQKEFDILLGKIRDSGIIPLWVGICPKDEGGVFAHAAKLSGGKSVVSTDLDTVSTAIDDIASVIRTQEESMAPSTLRVEFKKRLENGKNLSLSTQIRKELPPRKDSETVQKTRGVEISVDGELKPYDGELSSILSGDDQILRDVRIQKRMDLNVTKSNSAVKIHSKEAIFLTRIRGLDAPSHQRYLALSLELENILPEQKVAIYKDGSAHPSAVVGDSTPVRYETKKPAYSIPDLKKHLFLRINNSQTISLSDATFLAEQPLCLPGDPGVCIQPGQPVAGSIIFLVPSDTIHQFSLHLFDTSYGHIDIPLSGTMEYTKDDYAPLTTHAPLTLSDAFSLRAKGFSDVEVIDSIEAGDGCVFRIVEVGLTSNVQAHLNINPAKIISYRLHTHRGELVFDLHRLTSRVPLGLYDKSFVVPGSENTFRFVFRIPSVLAKGKNKGVVVVDLVDGPKQLNLSPQDGSVHLESANATGKGLAFHVHDYGKSCSGLLAIEVSIEEERDDTSTAIGETFVLKRTEIAVPPEGLKQRTQRVDEMSKALNGPSGLGSFGDGSSDAEAQPYGKDVIVPELSRGKYMFGLDQSSVVDDGTVRRGISLLQDSFRMQGFRLYPHFLYCGRIECSAERGERIQKPRASSKEHR